MKHLLRAYINNNVMNAVEDNYFLKSVVVPKRAHYEESESKTPSSTTKKIKERITCPVCPYTLGTAVRKNVMLHLNKYHSHLLEDERVVTFLEEKFTSS